MEAAEIDYARAELDVGAPARHVRGDGHRTGLAGLRDDLGFLLVELGVQHVVLDAPALQHAAKRFRGVDGGGPDQDGLALSVQFLDFIDDRVILLATGAEDHVVVVGAPDRLVGRDLHHVHLVDREELARFRHGRAGHARQLLVHAEVILYGDGRDRARFLLDLHAFLGLDGLVQALGQPPAVHQPAREGVDQDDLAVLDDVIDVLLVDRVGLEQLVHVVDAFAAF